MDIDEKYERRLEADRKYREKHREEISRKKHEYYIRKRDEFRERNKVSNAVKNEELKSHRRTLRAEMEKLVATYEARIAELERLVSKSTA